MKSKSRRKRADLKELARALEASPALARLRSISDDEPHSLWLTIRTIEAWKAEPTDA
jgi:hypothetical protein